MFQQGVDQTEEIAECFIIFASTLKQKYGICRKGGGFVPSERILDYDQPSAYCHANLQPSGGRALHHGPGRRPHRRGVGVLSRHPARLHGGSPGGPAQSRERHDPRLLGKRAEVAGGAGGGVEGRLLGGTTARCPRGGDNSDSGDHYTPFEELPDPRGVFERAMEKLVGGDEAGGGVGAAAVAEMRGWFRRCVAVADPAVQGGNEATLDVVLLLHIVWSKPTGPFGWASSGGAMMQRDAWAADFFDVVDNEGFLLAGEDSDSGGGEKKETPSDWENVGESVAQHADERTVCWTRSD
ncbi:hypothetical protein PspLS_01624 [Pyricularia sp. CBS 133598]|nr:hypothetical protein PspLS_01624 [Pyricularia sp. CBS 133598]